ncbi:hypothetical protein [Ilumatobacter sp.]|uniref:hypothetical protein n=1 Tax=Ilumatobacter sp. TaxID=1967498 RepID=UPI003C357FC1
MRNTLSTKILAATAVGILSIGAAACSSDGDDNENPTDTIDDVVDSAVDEVEGVVDTIDDAVDDAVDQVEGVVDTLGEG